MYRKVNPPRRAPELFGSAPCKVKGSWNDTMPASSDDIDRFGGGQFPGQFLRQHDVVAAAGAVREQTPFLVGSGNDPHAPVSGVELSKAIHTVLAAIGTMGQ